MTNATTVWPEMPFSVVVATGTVTVVLATLLLYVLRQQPSSSSSGSSNTTASDNGRTPAPPASSWEQEFSLEKYPGGIISVYYGTQTGTAESFARIMEREGPERGFYVRVVDLEDIKLSDGGTVAMLNTTTTGTSISSPPPPPVAVILCATYGEGEAPDNAVIFARELAERAGTQILYEKGDTVTSSLSDVPDPHLLQGLDYCVFGLGNKQYDHFNAMGKFMDHAFERVGAKRILPLGMGDDDDDLENDFETWRESQFWPTVTKLYMKGNSFKAKKIMNTSSTMEENGIPSLLSCPYMIEYHDQIITQPNNIPPHEIHSHSRHYFTAIDCPVQVVRELRAEEDPGSTVHVEIDISQVPRDVLSYQTADNLGVLPVNEPTIVERVAKALGYDLDAIFALKASPHHEWHGMPFPMPISVRECLTRYCDLTAPPRRSDLKLLAQYAHDKMDQKALARMASKDGRVEYKEKILDNYVGLADILTLCPSIAMPLEHFLNVCPLLQTRFFTISSSSMVYPDTIHLTVSVTSAPRKDGSLFKGLCSNYIASRKPGIDSIRVFIRPSSFRLPQDISRPIILIGPGTGIAPMRAFLQERARQRQQSDDAATLVGKTILYFGCKSRQQDYLYREELESYERDGVLDRLRIAFSRETDRKVYVQHLLREDGEETWKLLTDDGAHVYVCGGVKMGQDVAEVLHEIAMSHGNHTRDEAKMYWEKMSSQHRFVQELWA